jgi:hypothetical protein
MYSVPPDRAWWPAVGAPLERGVRPHCAATRTLYLIVMPCEARSCLLGCRPAGYSTSSSLEETHLMSVPGALPDGDRSRKTTDSLDSPSEGGSREPVWTWTSSWISPRPKPSPLSTSAMLAYMFAAPEGFETEVSTVGWGVHAHVSQAARPAAVAEARRGEGMGFGVRPNVRAKTATAVRRQARDADNVQRARSPGLVACRWRST